MCPCTLRRHCICCCGWCPCCRRRQAPHCRSDCLFTAIEVAGPKLVARVIAYSAAISATRIVVLHIGGSAAGAIADMPTVDAAGGVPSVAGVLAHLAAVNGASFGAVARMVTNLTGIAGQHASSPMWHEARRPHLGLMNAAGRGEAGVVSNLAAVVGSMHRWDLGRLLVCGMNRCRWNRQHHGKLPRRCTSHHRLSRWHSDKPLSRCRSRHRPCRLDPRRRAPPHMTLRQCEVVGR